MTPNGHLWRCFFKYAKIIRVYNIKYDDALGDAFGGRTPCSNFLFNLIKGNETPMEDELRTRYEIDQDINASPGMAFINREYSRSFSLNIFRANADELGELVRHMSDPEHGLRLMAADNREAGTQAHREVTRRVHNFVAAAKTLVDHTRVFMEENYSQTEILESYNQEIGRKFGKNQVSKFVHDLRNYMLHRGLHSSNMFIRYFQDPDRPDSGGEITTGVRIDANELKKWSGWTSPAREYLSTVGDEIEIESLVNEYTTQVEEIQSWIADLLLKFHATHMSELDSLRREYDLSESQESDSHENSLESEFLLTDPADEIIRDFSIPSSISNEINRRGDVLVRNIKSLNFKNYKDLPFQSERPVDVKITPNDLIDEPIISQKDDGGNEIIGFISHDSNLYGFDATSTSIFYDIVNEVRKIEWVQKYLDEKFINLLIINWCRSSFGSASSESLAESIIANSKADIKVWDVWAPIAHFEIERGFALGPVQILPISARMITKLEEDGVKCAPSQESQVRALFDRMRSTMQGYAAVVTKIEAVRERAKLDGLSMAREVVNLLRFFSPAASDISLFCPTSLLGSSLIPTSHILILRDDNFSYSESGVDDGAAYWKMSKASITELERDFNITSRLLEVGFLDDFERSVRSSMIMFGSASTFRELDDRLIYTISAVECILIKHESEARAYAVEKRLAKAMGYSGNDVGRVAHVVRSIYRFRARHGSLQWNIFERDILQEFVHYVRILIIIALNSMSNFGTRSEFVDAI